LIAGALLGSLFVKYVIGFNVNLGANAPNYSLPIPIVFGIEVLATALLMAVIFMVVYTKGLRGFGGIAIGEIVGSPTSNGSKHFGTRGLKQETNHKEKQ
jgi:aquaporin Z